MIKFKNITGDPFLAVGTIQRKFALNGEKSLSGVLYDGDDVLNSIDKGWSLEFDGEPYVVTYFERNDNDNTLSFDAVHKFFWNMSKSVLYSETSGSHTISWYLDQIFANTGYTYALNFKPKAVSKDNWGMKTKLALFNDIISSISGEFEINGTVISIFEKVGSDLSTIVRYGFNLSDMSIENDAAGFVTYGEGFGAYEDEQNQSGPRLHTTYTSPLASVYGILQAEPVDDQRYTIESNLKDAIKAKVDASFSVSIKLSLYDLTAAGYPYKMAHVGDWLMAIDERLDFKQRIRIISVDDEFDVNGNRISYTVTAGNVGVVQKYQAANASLASQVNNALETANKASDDANIALISANGKNTSYYVDGFDLLPTTANEGDLGWVQAGDGRVLYIYTKKPDGTFYWEKRIDPEMQEQITTGVNKAVSDAKTYSDQAIANNREQIDNQIQTINDKTTQLKNEQGELDRKAQGYANKALEDARSDVQKGLTDEANARVQALSDMDKKAAEAINKAKEDAQSALNALQIGGRNYLLNSNGSSLSGWSAPSLWSVTNDPVRGSVFMGQPTATWTGGGMNSLSQATTNVPVGSTVTVSFYAKANVDNARFHSEPLGTVVSFNPRLTTEWVRYTYTYKMGANNQRIYFMPVDAGTTYYLDDIKLEISNKATDYTQSPEDVVLDYTTKDNEIKRTLTQYQEANDGRVSKAESAASQAIGELATKVSKTIFDEKTGELERNYSNIKQTAEDIVSEVSNIQSAQGQQSGSISKLEQRADGFEATVSTLGRINQLFNTEFTPDFQGWFTGNSPTSGIYKTGADLSTDTSWSVASGKYKGSTVLKRTYGTGNSSFFSNPIPVGAGVAITGSIWAMSTTDFNGSVSAATYLRYYDSQLNYIGQDAINSARNLSWTQTTITRTTPTNTAFVVFNLLTNGNAGVTYYAQPMLTFTDKVGAYSIGNYNNNAAVAKVQLTADNAASTISNYMTSADGRMSNAESDIRQNAEAITTKVSQTEYNQKTGQIEGDISTFNQTASEISKTVANVQTQVNTLNQVNLVTNSQLAIDYSGWHLGTPWGTPVTNEIWNNGIADSSGAMYVWHDRDTNAEWMYSDPVPINGGQTLSASITAAMPQVPASGVPLALYIRTYNADKGSVDSFGYNIPLGDLSGVFTTFKLENRVTTASAKYASLVLAWATGGRISFGKPMLVIGNKVGDYVPGQYNNNDKIATQQITINGITEVVSNHTSDISSVTSRVTTAEGTITTTQNKVDDLESTQTQTAKQITSEVNDRKNGDTNTLTQANNFTTSSITSSESSMRSLVAQTSDAIIAQIGNTNLVTNSEFDPDNKGWYRVPADGATIGDPIKTPVTGFFADWDATNGSRGIVFGNETGTWMTSEPVKVSPSGTYSISLLAGRPAAQTVAVTMDFRLGVWDKDKKFITSIGGSNPMNGTTYLPLRYYKRENITIPSNAYYVSFVLGHSGTGTPDAVYQPMINHGATIAKYTPTYGTSSSSTILSLLKDNWSIGLADNIGAITSGIVGNTSSMSLISNNVIINSPSTQIKGTAWINRAMIGDGQIGTAQIGDAAITNAKVADLDVNKLTGNVSNFIQSNWNGKYASTTIDGSGMLVNGGNTTTKFDTTGAHYTNSSGISATYSFGRWSDANHNATSSTGLYLGATGSDNSFINILGTNGAAALVLAGSTMDYGANQNIMQGTLNAYVNVNIRQQLHFKGNKYNSPAYIEINENTRTFNFFTGGGSQGGGNYFWFNQNVLSAGSFSSTSVLSKKNVKSVYDEDALSEIAKTQLVNFAYKNRPDQNHVSPIIDDVNEDKQFYIPKTILGQDGEYVDMYSMISMAWRAIQQLNDKIGDR